MSTDPMTPAEAAARLDTAHFAATLHSHRREIEVLIDLARAATPSAAPAPRVLVVDADRTDERAYIEAIAPIGTARPWAEADLVVDLRGRVLKWRGNVTPATPLAAPVSGDLAAMLAEFHAALGQTFGDGGTSAVGRADMQQSETDELRVELLAGNHVGIAHELADVVYVAYGTAHSHGIDLDAVLREVHRANMTKQRGPDGLLAVEPSGKVVKGPRYRPPDVAAVLNAGCPTCTSHRPNLHPAVQEGGEVQLCPDPFHAKVTPENTAERVATLARDLPRYYAGLTGWWSSAPRGDAATERGDGGGEPCPGCGLDVELDWTRIVPPHDTAEGVLCAAIGARTPSPSAPPAETERGDGDGVMRRAVIDAALAEGSTPLQAVRIADRIGLVGVTTEDDRCVDEGCGHPRYVHTGRGGRCAEGAMKSTSAWRCQCQGFTESDEPTPTPSAAPAAGTGGELADGFSAAYDAGQRDTIKMLRSTLSAIDPDLRTLPDGDAVGPTTAEGRDFAADPSPRILAAEARREMARLLDDSSLGTPGARAVRKRGAGKTLTTEEQRAAGQELADLDRDLTARGDDTGDGA